MFSKHFLHAEWAEVVDAWQLTTWDAYRDVRRLGRKTRLPEQQREAMWRIFDQVRSAMAEQRMITRAQVFGALADSVAEHDQPPFDFTVGDEAQDINVAQLRFLAALGDGRPNSLFFCR